MVRGDGIYGLLSIVMSDIELARMLWNYHRLKAGIDRSDAILCLGGYDTRVAERASELFLSGFADLLVFSGGITNWTAPLFPDTEAEAFARIAVEIGVPYERIVVENKSTNIGENIQFTKKTTEHFGISELIIVTKPHTMRRAYATTKKQWPDVNTIIACPDIDFEEQPTELFSMRLLINEMVGDLQRMLVYPTRGFQVQQNIPKDVLRAYEQLVSRSYTRHLL